MKLYYAPGVCSLSPNIVLREAGYKFALERVDLKNKKTESAQDFNTINKKSYVPLLELDNGELLSEGVAIIQYLADLKPETKLAPTPGTLERARLNEWLNYIATELHKGFYPFFHDVGKQAVDFYREKLLKKFTYVAERLKGKKYLMGDQFTVADAYLYTILTWTKPTKIDLSSWPTLVDYMERISQRPSVQAALEAEGLLQPA